MGQGFSSANNVYVHVDRPYYSPGDVINGTVLINCVTPFESNSILLKIEGYEKTSWTEHWTEHHNNNNHMCNNNYMHNHNHMHNHNLMHNHGMSTTHTHRASAVRGGTREFFNIKVPLYSLQHGYSTIQPGQYQFPFSCMLPANLPGSFELTSYSGKCTGNGHSCSSVKAKIRYKVKAECVVPGMFKPNVRCKQHITVHERMARPPSQVIQQDHKAVKACCCISKGHVTINAHVEKDSYLPGETATAVVEIDNQSSVDFNIIALELKGYLTLLSNSGHRCEDKKIVHSCSLPGVKKGEQQLKDNARRLSVQLPSALMATTSGQLVKYEYKLVILLKGPMSVADPTVKLPITIYQAVPQYVAYTAPPPYWSPTVVGVPVKVSLPAAPPMAPGQEVMTKPSAYDQQGPKKTTSAPPYEQVMQPTPTAPYIPAYQGAVHGQPVPGYPAAPAQQYAPQPLYQQPPMYAQPAPYGPQYGK